jgi:hypothetical protein
MNTETFENLMRVILKRKRQAMLKGDQSALAKACQVEAALVAQYRESQA